MRRATLFTFLAIAVAAPSANARPAPPDPVPASAPPSQALVPSSSNGGNGLATGWIVALASGGAVIAAGAGFAGGRHNVHMRG
jgi:hypothetical protein